MQEHIYQAKTKRILAQSFTIWLWVGLQIGLNIFGVSKSLTNNRISVMILANIVLGMVTVPAIILFLKYYVNSVGKKFVITYNSLKFIDERTGHITEIQNSNIEMVFLVQNTRMSRLPWNSHEYFT